MRVLMLCPDCAMIDRRVLQEARTLVGAGYRVVLICGCECAREEHYHDQGVEIHRYVFDWRDPRLERLWARLRAPGPVRRLGGPLARRLTRLLPETAFDLFLLERARRFRADFVHVHDLPFLRCGARLAREWDVPLVFDAHEIYHQQACLGGRQRRQLARQERRALPNCRLAITVNESIAGWYEERYGIRPIVIMNGVEPPKPGFDRDSRRALRERAGLPPEGRVVLYQGWFSPERNLLTLVRSARYLPEGAWLLLVGYGDHERALRAALDEERGADRVRFLGRVEPEEILSLTAGADLGVIPYLPVDLNHSLCSPNKFFEYVTAGVPVIAHPLAFFEQMARVHGVVLTADLSTPQRMGAALRSLLEDEPRRSQMQRACRRASPALSWSVEGPKLVEAYAGLAATRGAATG
jgi:glycosyltransferase involved in cell wall biosynthesis